MEREIRAVQTSQQKEER